MSAVDIEDVWLSTLRDCADDSSSDEEDVEEGYKSSDDETLSSVGSELADMADFEDNELPDWGDTTLVEPDPEDPVTIHDTSCPSSGNDHGSEDSSRQSADYMPQETPHRKQTRAFKRFIEKRGDMASRVLDVLKYMKLQKLNLPILLEALSWTDETLISDENARYHRTQLLQSEELPLILRNWHQPPRQHGKGVRTKAAKKAMVTWAASTLSSTIKKEMTALKPLMRYPTDEVSEETLLAIELPLRLPCSGHCSGRPHALPRKKRRTRTNLLTAYDSL